MFHLLLRILITALAVLVSAKLVPGLRVRSYWSAIVFAVVLGVITALLHGLLVFLSLPLILVSLGLFLVVINAFLFWLADRFVAGVEVDGFWPALWGSLATSMITTVVYWLLPGVR